MIRRRTAALSLSLVPVLLLAACGDAPEDEGVTPPSQSVIAHRGYSAQAPENTLPAFRAAIEAGADMVELDYHHSLDGVPVVVHDDTLDRTTDVATRVGGDRVPVASKTLAELKTLDAGSWFDPRFAGTRMPTLEEALDTIHPNAAALIERKAGDAATLVALLERKGLIGEVMVLAFDWAFLEDCRRRAPRLVLCALGRGAVTEERLDRCAALNAALGWRHHDLTPEVVAAAHARGIGVWAYTVNDAGRARELLAMGVDGVVTNEVEAIAAALR